MANSITGLPPQSEQIIQERMMIAASRNIERRLRAELTSTYNKLARADGVGARAVILAEHGETIKSLLTQHYERMWRMFGGRILRAATKSKGGHEYKRAVPLTPLFDLAQKNWINLYGAQKVTQIAGTTEEQAEKIINDAIAEAVTQGIGENQTAALIRDRMENAGASLSRLRSRVIARTESHNASTAATQAAAEASGVPMRKQWVASGGERTRDSHRRADGQIVGMNEAFIVGGERLMYPGDQSGSAETTVNCRCVVAYIPDL